MKRVLPFILLSAFSFVSCSKSFLGTGSAGLYDSSIGHGQIVLGDQLENPYAINNMKSAFEKLYPTKSSADMEFTDYYVRFLPADSEELDRLRGMGLSLLDHPMDYEIVQEGDWYHDPSIASDEITWQYAVAPRGFVFPSDITYEVLQECYIAENSKSTKADAEIDWDAVEAAAFELTGNADMLMPADGSKAGTVQPAGRITIIDENYNGGQPLGVSGVKVECNVFVKFSSAYTDRDGYYKIPKKFTLNPRYRLVFSNSKGFSIGFNTILYKGSVSTLGKNSVSGVSMTVDASSDRSLFRRCVANNAAYDYYDRCAVDDLGIAQPSSGIVMWMFDKMDASSTPMIHHGTVLNFTLASVYYEVAKLVIKIFGPDITIGSKNLVSYREIYSTVVHELAHASHFAQVGAKYWDKYIYYILSAAATGGSTYGDASMGDSGYAAVGEMWAYYLEAKLYKERYGGPNPMFGCDNWFHPQILTYLESRGITASQIFSALTPEATDVEKLRDILIDQCPSKKTTITQVFNRYE